MKDTRKLSIVYFVISLIMLLMVCLGCERNSTNYVHNDNFVIQSDFGIIEVENGKIIYNNIK